MTPEALRDLLRREVVLLDGAMGTILMAEGLAAGRAPEWWNLERPDRVEAVHRAYVEAGSRIVLTNSFGASPSKLAVSGLEGRCREINEAAVRSARRAAGDRARVAGDMGPTGLLLPPVGDAAADAILAAYAEQAAALAEAGADLLVIETQFDLREARAALKAARATGLATVVTMTFEAKRRGAFTVMGDPLVDSLAALASEGADAVGCNCGAGPEALRAMVEQAGGSLGVPLVVKPNAGLPRATPQGTVYDSTPGSFAEQVAGAVAAGARLAGGCCGTVPDFIRALSDRLAEGASA